MELCPPAQKRTAVGLGISGWAVYLVLVFGVTLAVGIWTISGLDTQLTEFLREFVPLYLPVSLALVAFPISLYLYNGFVSPLVLTLVYIIGFTAITSSTAGATALFLPLIYAPLFIAIIPVLIALEYILRAQKRVPALPANS